MNESPKECAEGGANLRVLAERLGLGKSTVHRALSGSPRVSAETRRRVMEAASALGYRKDPFFAALVARRRQTRSGRIRLDYLLPPKGEKRRRVGEDEYELLHAQGEVMGYEVVRGEFAEAGREDALLRTLWAQGSAGFLVGWASVTAARALLSFRELPMLALKRNGVLPLHTVRFDAASAVRECWERLWAAGWRRIGCAVMRHDAAVEDDEDRLAAALALVATRVEPCDRVPPLMSDIYDHAAYFDWLRRYRPHAVIGFSPAHGILQRLSGFGHIPYVALHAARDPESRRIAGVLRPRDFWARQAIVRMDGMIRHGEVGVPELPVHTVIPCEWNPGDGIRRAR